MKALLHRAASSACGPLLPTYTLPNAPPKQLAASTAITREDIERLQVTNLPDWLKGTAGIDSSEITSRLLNAAFAVLLLPRENVYRSRR
jgi:hypothetical protein